MGGLAWASTARPRLDTLQERPASACVARVRAGARLRQGLAGRAAVASAACCGFHSQRAACQARPALTPRPESMCSALLQRSCGLALCAWTAGPPAVRTAAALLPGFGAARRQRQRRPARGGRQGAGGAGRGAGGGRRGGVGGPRAAPGPADPPAQAVPQPAARGGPARAGRACVPPAAAAARRVPRAPAHARLSAPGPLTRPRPSVPRCQSRTPPAVGPERGAARSLRRGAEWPLGSCSYARSWPLAGCSPARPRALGRPPRAEPVSEAAAEAAEEEEAERVEAAVAVVAEMELTAEQLRARARPRTRRSRPAVL